MVLVMPARIITHSHDFIILNHDIITLSYDFLHNIFY